MNLFVYQSSVIALAFVAGRMTYMFHTVNIKTAAPVSEFLSKRIENKFNHHCWFA